MGYNITDRTKESGGSVFVEYLTLDITTDGELTGLSDAGHESVDLAAEAQTVDQLYGAAVVGQENGGYQITYDNVNDRLAVKYADYDAASDGVLIDVPSGTDVGEVVLRLEGI